MVNKKLPNSYNSYIFKILHTIIKIFTENFHIFTIAPKIPFISRLKTQLSYIAASGSKYSSKVLQPRQLNKCVDDSPPARRVLSRRSKSSSDLRTAVTKPLLDPLSNKKEL